MLRGEVDDFPGEVGVIDGRVDLRGLMLPHPRRSDAVRLVGEPARTLVSAHAFRGVHWQGLDLSHGRLSALSFLDSTVDDCKFDSALCPDWGLWGSDVSNSSFVRANLHRITLGTWWEGGSNSWHRVDFAKADMREALASGCLLDECSFAGAKLRNASFRQATLRGCVFSGALRGVIFDGRMLEGEPEPGPLSAVDFSNASFEDVQFIGVHFENVTLPPGAYVLPRFPVLARRVVELLRGDESMEADLLRDWLISALRMPGDDDSDFVFNRADYLVVGDRFADFVESTFRQAASTT